MTFLPLPTLFFGIALAPGTAESDPSTEGMMFKIHVVPGIATDFEAKEGPIFTGRWIPPRPTPRW